MYCYDVFRMCMCCLVVSLFSFLVAFYGGTASLVFVVWRGMGLFTPCCHIGLVVLGVLVFVCVCFLTCVRQIHQCWSYLLSFVSWCCVIVMIVHRLFHRTWVFVIANCCICFVLCLFNCFIGLLRCVQLRVCVCVSPMYGMCVYTNTCKPTCIHTLTDVHALYVYTCLYIYIYTHTYAHIRTHMHTHTHTHARPHTHIIYIYIYIYMCARACVYVCVCVCVRVCACLCACAHVSMCV